MQTPPMPTAGLKELQHQTEDSLKTAQNTGRRVMLVSVGVLGLGLDLLRSASFHFLNSAEQRGARIEQGIGKQIRVLETRTTDELNKWRGRVQDSAERMNQQVAEGSQTVGDEVERRLDLARSRLGLPSLDKLEQLNVEVDQIDAKLDQELAKAPVAVPSAPWPGYDDLNAELLVAKLQKLDKDTLLAAQTYETGHKHRVTVLRELDRLLYAYGDETD